MSTIMQNLSAEQLAAIAAIVNGKGDSAPAPAHDSARTNDHLVSKKTGFLLIRALGNEVPDDEIVPTKIDSGEPALWPDGSLVTFGDLRYLVKDGATRADGTKCNDYPNVWRLTQDAAYAAWKIASAARSPKREAFKPKASPKATPAKSEVAEGIEVLVQREIARALAGLQLAGEPAKAEPTKPEPKQQAGTDLLYWPGDVIRVMVDGKAVDLQITEDAKRLRKTVV